MNNLYYNQQQYSTQSTEDPYKYYSSTTTTTTSAPSSSYNYNHLNNNNNNYNNNYNYNTNQYYDYSTTKTTTRRPTINPFYYGLDFYKNHKSTPFVFNPISITTTKSPYNFDNFDLSHLNQLQTTSSTVSPLLYYSSTTQPTTTPTPSFVPSSTPSPYIAPLDTTTYGKFSFLINKSPTRNPAFDLYFKRLASTTKSPYDFENFGQFNKRTTANPQYAYNLFGANSNNSPSNITASG